MLDNRSMMPATVIPQLAYDDVREAAGWLERAFGFTPRLYIGDHRVQMSVGEGALVLMQRRDDGTGERSSVMVRVTDIDDHCRKAEAARATIISVPDTKPYGERQYTAEDFAGHRWTFSESVADVHPADWGGALA